MPVSLADSWFSPSQVGWRSHTEWRERRRGCCQQLVSCGIWGGSGQFCPDPKGELLHPIPLGTKSDRRHLHSSNCDSTCTSLHQGEQQLLPSLSTMSWVVQARPAVGWNHRGAPTALSWCNKGCAQKPPLLAVSGRHPEQPWAERCWALSKHSRSLCQVRAHRLPAASEQAGTELSLLQIPHTDSCPWSEPWASQTWVFLHRFPARPGSALYSHTMMKADVLSAACLLDLTVRVLCTKLSLRY